MRIPTQSFVLTAALLAAACGGPDAPVAHNQQALTAAQCDYFEVGGKVRICHKTSSTKNPYTVLNISDNACVDAHAGHPGDYVAVDDPTCQGGGCLPAGAPVDSTLPCCEGLVAQNGVCVDLCANVVCNASDQCHTAGVCDPQTGQCSNPAAADGTSCSDGSACTQGDTCQAGACAAGAPVVCTASDQCHAAGVCDPQTGACSNPAAADGTGCDDGNACTTTDTCAAGVCGGSGSPCGSGTYCVAGGGGFTCVVPGCGNNVVEPGEACDDGNQNAGDGCRADCRGLEVCGDGLTDFLTEECDDGNDADPADGCHQCKLPPLADVPAQKINGTLSCAPGSGSRSNTGRKISSDALGHFYVVMICGGTAYVASSNDFGVTWSAPVSTGITGVLEAAVEGGPGNVAYVAATANPGVVMLSRSTDGGATWETPQTLANAVDSEVSIDSLGSDVYVEVVPSAGRLAVFANHQSGAAGGWTSANFAQLNAFHEVIIDKISGAVISASDNPAFRVRVSTDQGATFGAESNPPGSAFFSDWAGSRGLLYTTGTNGGTDIDIIPLSAPGTSTQVNGLPGNSVNAQRAIDADPLGNAYVVTRLNTGEIQLDRMLYQSGVISPADVRTISVTGSVPGVAGLPSSAGALVVYMSGTDVYAAVEIY